jgi:hypothetical protein
LLGSVDLGDARSFAQLRRVVLRGAGVGDAGMGRLCSALVHVSSV